MPKEKSYRVLNGLIGFAGYRDGVLETHNWYKGNIFTPPVDLKSSLGDPLLFDSDGRLVQQGYIEEVKVSG